MQVDGAAVANSREGNRILEKNDSPSAVTRMLNQGMKVPSPIERTCS